MGPGSPIHLVESHPLPDSLGRAGPGSLEQPLELRYDHPGGRGAVMFGAPHTCAPSGSGPTVGG
ncbi:hypothetical protein SUDANB6_00152 [Streptomyces sp. enrichment culture]|uniref:hypothetical protein n=1 Tax=Streptomyces sp. enrichment culture TaxID=1795815 RepID=UPI003F57B36B